MKFFRTKYVSNTISFFTGIVFLNMSFFLVEVSVLKLDQDKQMVENIAKLIAGCSAEEEKDAFGGSADEDVSGKEVDLIFNYHTYAPGSVPIALKNKLTDLVPGVPRLGQYEIFSPPPEV